MLIFTGRPVRKEFVIALPSQRPQGEEVNADGYRLTAPQTLLDLALVVPRERRGMLGQEFEDVVADKILAGPVGDPKDIDDAEGVVLDGEAVVFNDQILYDGYSRLARRFFVEAQCNVPWSTRYKRLPSASEYSSSQFVSEDLAPSLPHAPPRPLCLLEALGCFLFCLIQRTFFSWA